MRAHVTSPHCVTVITVALAPAWIQILAPPLLETFLSLCKIIVGVKINHVILICKYLLLLPYASLVIVFVSYCLSVCLDKSQDQLLYIRKSCVLFPIILKTIVRNMGTKLLNCSCILYLFGDFRANHLESVQT